MTPFFEVLDRFKPGTRNMLQVGELSPGKATRAGGTGPNAQRLDQIPASEEKSHCGDIKQVVINLHVSLKATRNILLRNELQRRAAIQSTKHVLSLSVQTRLLFGLGFFFLIKSGQAYVSI